MIINRQEKYLKIIEVICEIKGLTKDKLFKILKDRDCKYLLFLLLKKYRCEDMEIINKDFSVDIKRSINYNIKKAEERFLISREFREVYFEIDKIINKEIG